MFAALSFLAVEAVEGLIGIAATTATDIILEASVPALAEVISAESIYFEAASIATEVGIRASTKMATSYTNSQVEVAIEQGIKLTTGRSYNHSVLKKQLYGSILFNGGYLGGRSL